MRNVVERIATKTGCTPEQVYEVAGLVLEALHEETVKNEGGAGAILTEAAWLFSPNVCWHLNGILYEYVAIDHPEDTYLITETLLRFMPQEWEKFQPQLAHWLEERKNSRAATDSTANGEDEEEFALLSTPVQAEASKHRQSPTEPANNAAGHGQRHMFFDAEEMIIRLENCIAAGSRLFSRPYDMEEFPASSWKEFESWERSNIVVLQELPDAKIYCALYERDRHRDFHDIYVSINEAEARLQEIIASIRASG